MKKYYIQSRNDLWSKWFNVGGKRTYEDAIRIMRKLQATDTNGDGCWRILDTETKAYIY